MSIVAYNPSDPTQQSFLAALRQGESGSYVNPYSAGFSGQDLSSAPTDNYGFPIWSGQTYNGVPTHAAGAYQFQPGTWQGVASQYGLNFQNQSNQDAGAWYLAQQQYAANSNGGDLTTALQGGQYAGVSSALSGTWTSINANELTQAFSGSGSGSGTSMPTGSGNSIWNWFGGSEPDMSGPGTDTVAPNPLADQGKANPTTFWLGSGTISAINSWMGSFLSSAEQWFLRGGLIVIGLVLVAVGLVYVAGGPTKVTATAMKAMEA